MLNGFYENISSTAVVIIAISIMLFAGFSLTRVTKLLKLPNVTAYIVAGILIGPFCLDLIPQQVTVPSAGGEGSDWSLKKCESLEGGMHPTLGPLL